MGVLPYLLPVSSPLSVFFSVFYILFLIKGSAKLRVIFKVSVQHGLRSGMMMSASKDDRFKLVHQ